MRSHALYQSVYRCVGNAVGRQTAVDGARTADAQPMRAVEANLPPGYFVVSPGRSSQVSLVVFVPLSFLLEI